MNYVLFLVSLLSVRVAFAQLPAASPRVAAVQYAISNGLKLNRDSTVVIPEPNTAISRDGFWTRTPSTSKERMRDAQAIAALIGPLATVEKPGDVLSCFGIQCKLKGKRAVLTTEEPFDADSIFVVTVIVYSAGSVGRDGLSSVRMSIDVGREGSGWKGVRLHSSRHLINYRTSEP